MRRKPIPIERESNPKVGRRQAMVNATATETVMACGEFEVILAEVLQRADLPPTAQQHLSECLECASALDDFEAIADSVRQLPPIDEPVPDLWPQIRDILRREGVIHADGRDCAPAPKLVK